MRATRAIAAVLTTAACVVLAACGGGDDEADNGAAARSTTSSAAIGTGSGLGAERFEAVEAVYIAQVPLDDLEDDADEFKSASEPLVTACNALDAGDPLLGPLRRVCPVLTQFAEQLQGFNTCASDGADACDDLIGDVRRTLGDFTRLSRRGDEAVKDAELAAACERALLTPSLAYEAIEGFERAFELLDSGATAQADRALAAADAKAERLPDGDESLQRFRSGCR